MKSWDIARFNSPWLQRRHVGESIAYRHARHLLCAQVAALKDGLS